MAQTEPRVVLRVDDLRHYMAAAGISTQTELTKRMGGLVSESYVSRLLAGKLHPNLLTLFALRRVFPLLDPLQLFELIEDIQEEHAA